jgi:hypothetical protein
MRGLSIDRTVAAAIFSNMTLTFEPLLPPAAWVALAVCACALWFWYVGRRPSSIRRNVWIALSALMALGMLAVFIVLLNPIWLEPIQPPGGKPLLTILVDESASMATEDASDNQSRFHAATDMARQAASSLDDLFETRIHLFGGKWRSASPEELETTIPKAPSTDLATPLLDSLSSDRPQGQSVLVLSDGIHNAAGGADRFVEAATTARAWSAPVFTTTFGGAAQINDLELRVPRSRELAFAGQQVPVTVEVQQRGLITDRVTLTLTDSSGGMQTQDVPLSEGQTSTASFLVPTSEIGLFQYTVQAQAFPREASPSNNTASFQIRVVDEPVKALVLEGKPYWDNKFLLRMLTDDPSLEVDCIVRITPDRFLLRHLRLVDSEDHSAAQQDEKTPSSGTPQTAVKAKSGESATQSDALSPANAAVNTALPAGSSRFQRKEDSEFVSDTGSILLDPVKLREYQILLLGRESEHHLTGVAVENIRDWLSKDGGSLVCYRGSPVAEPDQKLSRLLPVRWAVGRQAGSNESRFRIQVTERGDDLSWLRIGGADGLSKLPSLAASSVTDSVKPLAVVLGRGASATGSTPVLTYQPYGTGKVVVVEGSGMWRWAFLPPEHRELDPVYGVLWQSLMRWLVSSGGLLPGEDMALQMDRLSFREGESASAVVLKRSGSDLGEIPAVTIHDAEGKLLQTIKAVPVGDELGVYQVFIGVLPVGQYEARMDEAGMASPSDLTTSVSPDEATGSESSKKANSSSRTVSFDVRPDLSERLEIAARPDLMNRVAEVSGGAVIPAAEPDAIRSHFIEHLRKSRPVQFHRRPAWDRWWVLILILLLWSTSWALRRRAGLI